jgi:hypothetical protein
MFGIKLSPWIIAIGAVGLLVLAAYFYYQRSENEKAELRAEISVLKENEVKYLQPYGSTTLRVTELPFIKN